MLAFIISPIYLFLLKTSTQGAQTSLFCLLEDDNSIIDLDTDVPYWQHYYVYSADGLADASMEQRDFYKNFKLNFLNGIYLDIKENLIDCDEIEEIKTKEIG